MRNASGDWLGWRARSAGMRRSSERDAFLSAARRARKAGVHGPSPVSPTFERTGHSGSGARGVPGEPVCARDLKPSGPAKVSASRSGYAVDGSRRSVLPGHGPVFRRKAVSVRR